MTRSSTARPLQYLNLGAGAEDSGGGAVVAPITVAELANALRLGVTPEELAEAERLLSYATEAVTQIAPDAPAAATREAIIRLCAYQFDRPNSGRGSGWSNAVRNSGAGAILASYRQSPVATDATT